MSSFDSAAMTTRSGLKLPDISHQEEQHEQSSPNNAVSAIQTWYRSFKERKVLKDKVLNSVNHLNVILSVMKDLKVSKSFEKSQRELFGEKFNKSVSSLVALLPHNTNNSAKVQQAHIVKTKKAIASALIISKFPENVLFSEEIGGAAEQSFVTKECLYNAILLARATKKFSLLATTTEQSPKRLEFLIQSLVLSIVLFTTSFEKWQVEDSFRMFKSLEDSFIETYSALIVCKYSVLFQNGDPSLLHTTEQQLLKLQDVMYKMMGKTAKHRMEELCASIEASMMPMYHQIKNYEEIQEKKRLSVAGSTTSSNTSSPSKVTSPTASANAPSRPFIPTSTTSRARSASEAERMEMMESIGTAVAAVQPPQPQQLPSPELPPILLGNDKVAMKYLEKLAQLTGMSVEPLAHEMTLDRFYRLPAERPTLESVSDGAKLTTASGKVDPAALATADRPTIALLLRTQLLQTMADKMVNSLLVSRVNDVSELAVGMVVPLRLAPNTYTYEDASGRNNNDSDNNNDTTAEVLSNGDIAAVTAAQPPVMSARITAINPSDGGDSPTMDVEYIYETNLREERVSLKRVKLSSHASDPTIFLSALQELCLQIASFTPNRTDLINNIFTTVDFNLLRQIIENNAVTPSHDLLPVFQYLQRALQDLQAPSRVAATQQWIDGLAADFQGRSFQEVVPLLPAFFERASDTIEEIQRDMANFYISSLVPVMQTHGAAFLSQRFQQRLQLGETTLDATASLLRAQLTPTTVFAATVKDIVEAGACGDEGFSLQQLIAQSPPQQQGSGDAAATALTASTTAAVTLRNQLRRAVVARAFLSLLQVPVRLDSRQAFQLKIVPETLLFDASRLAAVRDAVDKVALECSIVITSRQILSLYRTPFKDNEEVELQHRLDVLLTEKDSNFASITVEVVKYVKYALYRHRELGSSTSGNAFRFPGTSGSTSPLPPLPPPSATAATGLLSPVTSTVAANYDLKELQERVERTIRDVVAPGNPVLTLFTKRLYKILLRVMLGQQHVDKLASYSLHSKGQERNLTTLIDSVVKLFNHSYNVHGELYGAVLNTLATAAMVTDAAATTSSTAVDGGK